MSSTTPVNESSLRIFIGKNYEYFQQKWAIAEQRKNKLSWNWAAFLIGVSWMAYRKMYLYSWIFIGAIIVETLCELAFGFPEKLSVFINFFIAGTFGWRANSWYKAHVEKTIRELSATTPPEQLQIELARQGGTNIGAAIGFFVTLVVLLVLVAAVAEG